MLRTRVLTALVLLALLLAVLFFLPRAAGIGLFAAIVLLGAWEWAAFAGLTSPAGRLAFVLVSGALCAAAWRATVPASDWLRCMQAAALWWVAALCWLALRPHWVSRAAAAVAGLFVLVPAWLGLARLLALGPGTHGATLLLYMLVIVWASDIGGYFVGRRFGRLKLAPAVSPGKTWEGVAGGTLLGLLVALAGSYLLPVAPARLAVLGLVVVGASMVGDLTESMFKRFAHLKDSGSLLPGHGGVLDRIDSVTAAVPFFVIGLRSLGLLA